MTAPRADSTQPPLPATKRGKSGAGSPDPAEVVLVKVSPERILQGAWYRMPLLGLGCLAGYLRSRGVAVAIVDALFDRLGLEETVAAVTARAPRVVGFTAMTHEVNRAAQVAQEIRRAVPGAQTVIGGPHATALPRRTLEECEVFDFAVFGEGEETLFELVEALRTGAWDFGGVKGLAWRLRGKAGEIVTNERRPWVEDLDRLPPPAWDLYGPSDVYQIFASRGCPYRCIFCMRVLGERVRFRSPRNVVDEMESVVERYHPRQIDFSDETWTLRHKWVYEVCDEIIGRGLHEKVRWFANGRVNTVNEDLLRRMREAGCFRIGYGIESGNDEILEKAQKGTTVKQIEEAVAATKRAGLEIEAFYILGFPGETRRTALDTIGLAARLNTTTAAFGIMAPYPGTKVAEMAARGEGGYRILSRDWSDFDKHLGNALELDTLSRRELERLQARAYLWFYIRNLRLWDLARFLWEKRRAVGKIARKMMGLGRV
ncbi:MAG TPA: radical SAM protein [Sumerlaeia bacterium]|nr:radical SAM protein [Sumerlaeia bacterium]